MQYENIIIDGSYLARSRYETQTLPKGFLDILHQLRNEYSHKDMFIVWDHPKGSLSRKKILPCYKRKRTHPIGYQKQLLELKYLLRDGGFMQVESADGEGDDVMNELCKISFGMNLVWTCDKDLLQLIQDGNVHVLRHYRGAKILITRNNFKEFFGINPEQWIDYLAMVGDQSDGIPGVTGIGKVIATRILKVFDGLDNLNLEDAVSRDSEITKFVGLIKLKKSQESIAICKEVIKLRRVKLEFIPPNMKEFRF